MLARSVALVANGPWVARLQRRPKPKAASPPSFFSQMLPFRAVFAPGRGARLAEAAAHGGAFGQGNTHAKGQAGKALGRQ